MRKLPSGLCSWFGSAILHKLKKIKAFKSLRHEATATQSERQEEYTNTHCGDRRRNLVLWICVRMDVCVGVFVHWGKFTENLTTAASTTQNQIGVTGEDSQERHTGGHGHLLCCMFLAVFLSSSAMEGWQRRKPERQLSNPQTSKQESKEITFKLLRN